MPRCRGLVAAALNHVEQTPSDRPPPAAARTAPQTDVSFNVRGHNKYYIIQLLEDDAGGKFYSWQRWGRIGAVGGTTLKGPQDLASAMADFKGKFRDKTNNAFDAPTFQHVSGKYDRVAVDYDPESADSAPAGASAPAGPTKAADAPPAKPVESKLDPRLQSLVQLISNIRQMEKAMIEMNYDVQKAPLGKLTKQQIRSGYEALKEIEDLVRNGTTSGAKLVDACNRFYTRIPHDFGFSKPPLIVSLDVVAAKARLLEALGEIEIAMKVLQDKTESEVHIVARGKGRAASRPVRPSGQNPGARRATADHPSYRPALPLPQVRTGADGPHHGHLWDGRTVRRPCMRGALAGARRADVRIDQSPVPLSARGWRMAGTCTTRMGTPTPRTSLSLRRRTKSTGTDASQRSQRAGTVACSCAACAPRRCAAVL